MVVMSFLAGLLSEFETAKSQILSIFEISCLEDAIRSILHTRIHYLFCLLSLIVLLLVVLQHLIPEDNITRVAAIVRASTILI